MKAASVCVYETVDEPAGIEQLLQVAKSSSTGNFGVEIPGGPSRSFRVAYRYNDRQLESPSMYLDSSVKPFFKVEAEEEAPERQGGQVQGADPRPGRRRASGHHAGEGRQEVADLQAALHRRQAGISRASTASPRPAAGSATSSGRW